MVIPCKRVLLTGGTGFVGRRLVRLLAGKATVATIIRTGSATEGLPGNVRLLFHDGSTARLLELVADFQPDAVVHAASMFIPEHEPEDVDRLIEANVKFGCQLLEAMSKAGAPCLVDFGTSWQHFESVEPCSDAYHPVSLYAATKQAFQDIIKFYVENRDLRALTIKLSDTYGPDDPRKKIVALFDSVSLSGETLAMSPGGQRINLVHVDDVVEAVAIALRRVMAANPGSYESFSVRGPEVMTLREFASLYERATGRCLHISWGARSYRRREVMQPWEGDVLPGWTPKIALEYGLAQVAKAF